MLMRRPSAILLLGILALFASFASAAAQQSAPSADPFGTPVAFADTLTSQNGAAVYAEDGEAYDPADTLPPAEEAPDRADPRSFSLYLNLSDNFFFSGFSWQSWSASFAFSSLLSAWNLAQGDAQIHTTRNRYLSGFRVHYDDYLQFAPHLLLPTFALLGKQGSSQLVYEPFTAMGAAYLITAAGVWATKYAVGRTRPDGSSDNSYPSGHTATAFVGATLFDLEYGEQYPGLSLLNYALATSVGVGRILNNRHWASDVFMGAGWGILSARLGTYIARSIFLDPSIAKLSQRDPVPDRGIVVGMEAGRRLLGLSYRNRSSERQLLGAVVGYKRGMHRLMLSVGAGTAFSPESRPVNEVQPEVAAEEFNVAFRHYALSYGLGGPVWNGSRLYGAALLGLNRLIVPPDLQRRGTSVRTFYPEVGLMASWETPTAPNRYWDISLRFLFAPMRVPIAPRLEEDVPRYSPLGASDMSCELALGYYFSFPNLLAPRPKTEP